MGRLKSLKLNVMLRAAPGSFWRLWTISRSRPRGEPASMPEPQPEGLHRFSWNAAQLVFLLLMLAAISFMRLCGQTLG